eukprot:5569995-Pyramimonas_sp.AAC.1
MKDPPSKPIKRKAEDDHDEEYQQATQHRQLDMEQDEEMSEVNDIRLGLNMMGFDSELVEWLTSGELNI